MTRQIAFEAAQFRVNVASRTLTGTLLPFNTTSRPSLNPSTGKAALWHFPDGTVQVPEDPSDVVLNYGHDTESLYMQVGTAASLSVVPGAGVEVVWNIARTPEGDRILALAEAKVLRKFSAELEGDFDAEESDTPGVPLMRAKSAAITGGAVVLRPAFVGADITSVAASAAQNKERTMTQAQRARLAELTALTTRDAEQEAEFSTLTALAAAAPAPVATDPAQADLAALSADVEALNAQLAALQNIQIPVGPGSAQLQVVEEPIYRFAGSTPAPSGFDFATDLLAAAKDGDKAALARLQKFTSAEAYAANPRFADQPTTTGDVASIANQPQYRPDMFLGQAPTPQSPLFDYFVKGGLSNVQPFFHSKLDRTNTDIGVSDHTEGVEPESRDLVTATGATVTPSAMSGKVHITREVADLGGNPQVSGLIKTEFDRSFAIAKETKTAALIAAAMGSVASLNAAIAAGADGAAAGQKIEAGLIGLQFLADGSRFKKMFGHVDLYTVLAAYENAQGEKRYPIINPQNRSGIAGDQYSFLDIAGYRMTPAASLGATSAGPSNSLVADPEAVRVWVSGLNNLGKLQEDVEGWDIGVFAYFAGIVYDVSGLRKIAYDPIA